MQALKDKVAIVTGSTSGIGLGIAQAFAAAGSNLVINGFGEADAIESTRQRLAACGVQVVHHAADVSKPGEVAALVHTATRTFGKVDILVNNAGIQHVAAVQAFPADQWDRIIAINLSAAFHATKAVLPEMLERNWGRVINIASVHGLVASPFKAAYVAAKHGIVGLTKVVALETAQTGVTCNAICPGWVLTPLVDTQIRDRAATQGATYEAAKLELLAEKQPSREFTTTAEIAGLAMFMCSESAAQMRGQAVALDGGWTAQ